MIYIVWEVRKELFVYAKVSLFVGGKQIWYSFLPTICLHSSLTFMSCFYVCMYVTIDSRQGESNWMTREGMKKNRGVVRIQELLMN